MQAAIPSLCRLLVIAIGLACAFAAPAQAPVPFGQPSKDSVWVPTPERMIRRMLQLADVTPQDLVIDLGSGDGRIPIHAAKHFGARAIGVELEANLVALSEATAKAEGVAHLARFLRQDLYQADLSAATVIALYISPGVMERLRPRLLALRPGTRVVSHYFTLGDWEPDESVQTEGRMGHLWVVPADLRGRWTLSLRGEASSRPGDALRLHVEQKHQALSIRGERNGRAVAVIGTRLRGAEIQFSSFDPDGHSRQFRGRIEGHRMHGRSEGMDVRPLDWEAVRD